MLVKAGFENFYNVYRWHGRQKGQRSGKRLQWQADEEWRE
jgi:hypothetical protein